MLDDQANCILQKRLFQQMNELSRLERCNNEEKSEQQTVCVYEQMYERNTQKSLEASNKRTTAYRIGDLGGGTGFGFLESDAL